MTLKRAFLIILLAFAWLIIFATLGGMLERLSGSQAFSGIVFPVALCGFVILILWGFALWAGAKGYSPWLGVVLAWIGPLGMLVLVFLSDRSIEKTERRTTAKA